MKDTEQSFEDEQKQAWNWVTATLIVSDKNKSSDEISKKLELSPHYVTEKGSYSKNFPETSPTTVTVWRMDTRQCKSSDVEAHLSTMEKLLSGRLSAFQELRKDGSEVYVSVQQTIRTEDQHFELNTELLRFFSEYEIRLTFFYTHRDSPPDENWLRRRNKF